MLHNIVQNFKTLLQLSWITRLSLPGKIYSWMLEKNLRWTVKPWSKEERYRFCSGLGTTDQFFTPAYWWRAHGKVVIQWFACFVWIWRSLSVCWKGHLEYWNGFTYPRCFCEPSYPCERSNKRHNYVQEINSIFRLNPYLQKCGVYHTELRSGPVPESPLKLRRLRKRDWTTLTHL